MSRLNDTPFQLLLRRGLKADLTTLATIYSEAEGELLLTSDELAVYVFDSAAVWNRPLVGQFPRRVVTGNDTAALDDYYIAYTDTTAAWVLTLPSAATVGANKAFIIKDETGGAGANNITVTPAGAETIDGAATFVIGTNYGTCRLISDGANWFTW